MKSLQVCELRCRWLKDVEHKAQSFLDGQPRVHLNTKFVTFVFCVGKNRAAEADLDICSAVMEALVRDAERQLEKVQ